MHTANLTKTEQFTPNSMACCSFHAATEILGYELSNYELSKFCGAAVNSAGREKPWALIIHTVCQTLITVSYYEWTVLLRESDEITIKPWRLAVCNAAEFTPSADSNVELRAGLVGTLVLRTADTHQHTDMTSLHSEHQCAKQASNFGTVTNCVCLVQRWPCTEVQGFCTNSRPP